MTHRSDKSIFPFSTVCCVFVVGSSFEFSLLGLSVRFIFTPSVATGWEYLGTTSRWGRKIPRIKLSTKDVASNMSIAKFGAIPNQIRLFKSSRRRCSRMNMSNVNGCVVAVRSVLSLFYFTLFRHSSVLMGRQIRCTPTPVWRRRATVCITVVVGPNDIRILYVFFAVSAISLNCEGNSSCPDSEAVHSWGFFVTLPMLRCLER